MSDWRGARAAGYPARSRPAVKPTDHVPPPAGPALRRRPRRRRRRRARDAAGARRRGGAPPSDGEAAGASFVATLRGEHAERQQLAFDRRRALALDLAAARRDRLLGVLAVVAAALGAGAARALARISEEIDEDHQHLRAQGPE